MDSLSLELLKKVPWLAPEDGSTYEPPVDKVIEKVNVPFLERECQYSLFYSWVESIKCVSGNGCRVLDASCGKGMISQVLMFKGHQVSACDLMDYFKGDREKIDYRLVDLNGKMPYEDNSFDYVLNCEGLQYLQHMAQFFEESARVLKKDGHLVLSVPNIHSVDSRILFMRKGMLSKYHVEDERITWQIIYMPYLLELLKKYRFEIISITGNVCCMNPKARWFYKLFKRFMEKENPVFRLAHSLIIHARQK